MYSFLYIINKVTYKEKEDLLYFPPYNTGCLLSIKQKQIYL